MSLDFSVQRLLCEIPELHLSPELVACSAFSTPSSTHFTLRKSSGLQLFSDTSPSLASGGRICGVGSSVGVKTKVSRSQTGMVSVTAASGERLNPAPASPEPGSRAG